MRMREETETCVFSERKWVFVLCCFFLIIAWFPTVVDVMRTGVGLKGPGSLRPGFPIQVLTCFLFVLFCFDDGGEAGGRQPFKVQKANAASMNVPLNFH